MSNQKKLIIKIKNKEKLKEYNPAGRRINLDSKYKDLINASIKQVLLSSRFKSSLAANKFYAEDVQYLERLLATNLYSLAKRVKVTLDPSIVNQAVKYAVQDAISGKYNTVKEADGEDLAIKQTIDKAKTDIAQANKRKADKKAKQARDKLELLKTET